MSAYDRRAENNVEYAVLRAIAIAIAIVFTTAPVLAQVVDTPEQAKARADFINLPQNEQTIVAGAIGYAVRDARDLCGFKLTAVAEHMIAGGEKFLTVEQKSLAEALSYKTRPRAPVAEFCNTVKAEFEHAPAKWFAD